MPTPVDKWALACLRNHLLKFSTLGTNVVLYCVSHQRKLSIEQGVDLETCWRFSRSSTGLQQNQGLEGASPASPKSLRRACTDRYRMFGSSAACYGHARCNVHFDKATDMDGIMRILSLARCVNGSGGRRVGEIRCVRLHTVLHRLGLVHLLPFPIDTT